MNQRIDKFLNLNARGTEVADLQGKLQKLNFAIPQSELNEKEKEKSVFGVRTRDAVMQLQTRYKLDPTGILDEKTQLALERAIAEIGISEHRVEGRIVFEHGLPAVGINLRIYNHGFGDTLVRLGEVTTDEQGFYSLSYNSDSKAINLEVRVDDRPNEREVSLSTIKRNANKNEVLNLVAPSTLQPLAPEYERLTHDLSEQLEKLDLLATAQENGDRQDLTLLHQSTNWDARLIALATFAFKLSSETGLSHDILYALFRVGLPTDKEQLALLSGETVKQALEKSQKANIVNLDEGVIARAKAVFENFANQTRRAAILPGTVSSVDDFLNKISFTNDNQKSNFADLSFAYEGEELWQQAKASGISSETISALQLQGKLAYLTLNNANLTDSLQKELKSLDNLAQLADKDLYEANAWKARLNSLAGNDEKNLEKLIPSIYDNEKIGDRLDAYAADLARKVRLSYPTPVVSRMIEKDELHLGDRHSELKAPVRTFLQNAQSLGFELGRTPISAFIRDNRAVFNGINAEQVEDTTESIKLLQRLYQITPTNESLKVLMAQGFTSAQDVVAFPYEKFVDRFAQLFPSQDEARLAYRKAEQVTNITSNLVVAAQQLDNAPAIYATSPPASSREAAKNELIKHYPTMETLFGSLDFCECEHCRSVLSPAAYFVDLLQFIDPKPSQWQYTLSDWKTKHQNASYPFKNPTEQADFLKTWRSKHPGQPDPNTEKTPYEVLIERRPDLPNLPLTCENTQTTLPYIDIVNEILEYYVAKGKLAEDSGHDTGSATTAELLAEPQNILVEAYTKLQQAHYPLSLPFDLWLETVRQFFNHFQTPLSQVLEILRPTDELFPPATNPKSYYRNAILAESLGISPSEYNTLTNFDPQKWYELYGFDTSETNPTSALKFGKNLSRQLGVSYKELVELVSTGFVNPKLETLVTLGKLGVDIEDVFRYKNNIALLSADEKKLRPQQSQLRKELEAFEQRLNDLTKKFNPNFDPNKFNAKTWLDTTWQNGGFNQILVLADPDARCNFDLTTLEYANGNPADAIVFLKLNFFVRLWRKLGWTITQTDRALQVFVPKSLLPLTATNLGTALKTALVYIAHFKEISDRINVGKDNRLKLLALWSNLSTTGSNSLYAQLFLQQSVLKNDSIFDDPLGNYLSNPRILLKDHLTALQGALNLTADDITRILTATDKSLATADLSLDNVSLLYRYGLLAKALKLSIRDFIVLKELSGLDPVKLLKADELKVLTDDYPFTQTIQFIEIAEKVKQSGFQIADLDYLLRHRFDKVGNYRQNSDAVLALVKTLATEIRRIQTEHAIPDDPASISDEVLRQKLALVMPPDVVETFFGMWTGNIEYEAIQNVSPDNQLNRDAIVDPAVRITYNSVTQVQRLTFRGVLLDEKKAQLLTPANPSPLLAKLLADLLDAVQIQAQTFFTKYFGSFLQSADFNKLFAPISIELNDTAKQLEIRNKRNKLVQAFLPFLQKQLIRQLVVQTFASNLNADVALIEALLTNQSLLSDPSQNSQPLLNGLAAMGEQGISASFFTTADGTGTSTNMRVPTADTTAKPNGTNSAHLESYFEVPATGDYRFFVAFEKKDAEAEFWLAHLPDSLLRGKANTDKEEISEFTELKAGVPYRFMLDVRNLGGGDVTVLIQGETLPKDSLRQLILYPQAAVEQFERSQILLAKTLQLIQGFALNEREVRYLLTHPSDFDHLDFSKLPTRTADDLPRPAISLFQQFLRLADYASLKRNLAGSTDDLISIFENARRTYPASVNAEQLKTTLLEDLYKRVADLTRRDVSIIRATAQQLGFTAQSSIATDQLQIASLNFTQEIGIKKLWEVLQLVEKFGVPVEALTCWATPVPDFAIARELRNTVKASYEAETWQQIAQSIFDKLRQQQRDALVAYIMPRYGFERIEQLFEYFLIDPGMEPVVQTSRMRLAISSVQLFIQRCLLNLEPQVHPLAINSKHWQWMKRYRVWEANRKIFLYPENWLEPEFRDDKTHLFAELESALLQSNISNDVAEDAFFKYLKKLDELARLEIVTMYSEENPLKTASSTLHVIGRTYSLPHKYFYRRYTNQKWTPWEPVSAEIEGDHIAAVVWRDRLHLFWLTFLEKAKTSSIVQDKNLTEIKFNELVSISTKEIEIHLNWSEYFQGQWTTRESGGFDNPIRAEVNNSFDKRQVFIHVSKEFEDGEERAVKINFANTSISVFGILLLPRGAFRVVSKNSTPEQADWTDYYSDTDIPYTHNRSQTTQYIGSTALQVTFVEQIKTINGKQQPTQSTKDILRQNDNFSLLMPSNSIQNPSPEIGMLKSPFFYQNNQQTFFVEPTLTEPPLEHYPGWPVGAKRKSDDNLSKKTPIEVAFPYQALPHDSTDSTAKYQQRYQKDWIINPGTVLQFDKALIGQKGGINEAKLPVVGNISRRIGAAITNNRLIDKAQLNVDNLNADFRVNIVGIDGLNQVILDNLNLQLNIDTNLSNGKN
jgi:hypothetical protein